MDKKQVIKIETKNIDYFNYTFYLNKFNFITAIHILNIPEPLTDVEIIINSTQNIFEPFSYFLDAYEGESLVLNNFDFKFNIPFLKNLTEKDKDAIQIVFKSKGEELASTTFHLDILPMDYFGGLQEYPQLLVSYSLPNHPFIYDIKSEAIKILEEKKQFPSFDAYQKQNKERVLQVTAALFYALQKKEIIYSAIPPSFETKGQRIRLIDKVLSAKFGNCIDISLLFTALLESVGLNPLIIITKGHAFVGVWLEDKRMDTIINYDQAAISKRIAPGINEIAIIEMTMLCKGNTINFRDAVHSAEMQLNNAKDFIMAIDVKSARAWGVHPLPLGNNQEFIKQNTEELIENNTIIKEEDSFDFGPKYEDLELRDDTEFSKIKLWERKLLDLSLRNNLLNIRFSRNTLQLIDVKINLLEDALFDGKQYTIMPNSNVEIKTSYNEYLEPLHPSSALFKLADEEFNYNRLLTNFHPHNLDNILTHLFRTARIAEEENGMSTLYLGLGLLKWYEPKKKNQVRLAPILLIPVALSRRSVKSKYVLKSREDETMINITLIEYLKQEYKLNLDALEQLPLDDFGVDVPKVLAILRNAVLNLEGWDVLEQVVLGNFSFNKLLLWQDLNKHANEIEKSPIVKSLIEGKLSTDIKGLEEEDFDLEKLSAAELLLPIATDNSQLNAIKNAHLGKTFILHGPPGTGKSQTITNIIADALANNKKVLFVAAKKAALDVVHSRLEKIGLGPFCLELHSNKSKKSDVLGQFEKTLDLTKYQLSADFNEKAKRLDERREQLNKYVYYLHQENNIGWSLYHSVSYLEQNGVEYDKNLRIDIDLDTLDRKQWNNWNDWLLLYSSVIQKIKNPKEHPLSALSIAKHDIDNAQNIVENIDDYLEKYARYSQIEKDFSINSDELDAFLSLLSILDKKLPKKELISIIFNPKLKEPFLEWIKLQENYQLVKKNIEEQYYKEVYKLDYENLRQKWNQAKFSWFLPKWLEQRKIKKEIQGFATVKIASEEQVDSIFDKLDNWKEIEEQLKHARFATFSSFIQSYSSNNELDIKAIKEEIAYIETLEQSMEAAPIEDKEKWLLKAVEFDFAKEKILEKVEEYAEVHKDLQKIVFAIPSIEELKNIKSNIAFLEDWVNYQIYKNNAEALNLHWFTTWVEEGKITSENIEDAFYEVLHFNHFIQKVYAHQELRSFDATLYKSLIKQYRDLHQEFTAISRKQLIAKLSANIPNSSIETAQSSEIAILQRAIRSRGRGISIRRLFDQIPNLIPRLKPCMLMSPISVAQYFDVSKEHFDMVIFDEASQLETFESVSALARAKQAIIVGDPKQMPPTSFFSSNKLDEEHLDKEDLESILEDCLALSIPSKFLLRHYRSRHESLISFSNKNYYDSKLLTFPSPDDLSQKVSLELIDGFYDKGKTRTNEKEAEAVIAYIKKHWEERNPKSIGVVTFNQAQQSLIEDLLQNLLMNNPDLEEFALGNKEEIFIKNLENVQGDERDIILFSIGYGPDKEGKISMNFGPLNRDGGWRRLNVAVTRARFEMKVFSTLKSEQIDLSRTKSEGVKGLKEFLSFAEKGDYSLSADYSKADKNTLVDAIGDYLTKNGLQVRKYIGSSEYKVDLGIVHPENEKEYILGVLIDGLTYLNIETTNDRELLAPNVLKGLGWNIFRIWTLDWVKHKDKIVQEIKNRIKDLLEGKDVQKEEIVSEQQDQVENEELLIPIEESKNTVQVPYKNTDLRIVENGNSDNFYYYENQEIIRNQMKQIIETEAPISKSLLFKKILVLWNVSRAGNRLNIYLNEQLDQLSDILITEAHQTFLWNNHISPKTLDYYRDNAEINRSIEDIAPEEIAIAMLEIMEDNLSMDKNDLLRMTARKFNFMKLGRQIELVISQTLNALIQNEQLKIKEDRVSLEEV